MNIIDTRDLIETRDELKEQILESFLEDFPHYADMTESFEDIRFEEEELDSWKLDWVEDLSKITRIDELVNEIGSEFEDGVQLIEESDFEDYCADLLKDLGYISRDFPSWIEIDWESTASNIRLDYGEVEFDGITYLYRA